VGGGIGGREEGRRESKKEGRRKAGKEGRREGGKEGRKEMERRSRTYKSLRVLPTCAICSKARGSGAGRKGHVNDCLWPLFHFQTACRYFLLPILIGTLM
jgi:hypothetical protein